MWWGWLCPSFKAHLRRTYPWIRVVYVPASCTPVGQPMDAGIIAMIKGEMRRLFSSWSLTHVLDQLNKGVANCDIFLDLSLPTMKKNIVMWASAAMAYMDDKRDKIIHCWEKTGLLAAWEHGVQVEAASKASELFPNLADLDSLSIEIDSDNEEPVANDPFENDVMTNDEEVELGVHIMEQASASMQEVVPAEPSDDDMSDSDDGEV
mmetsp:Transcript_33951/g.107875  ORF Transcript_33951/g.107875 Transcript_33951/m.107875 type:complete len:207 (-) Transcript_33951:19-639(-)